MLENLARIRKLQRFIARELSALLALQDSGLIIVEDTKEACIRYAPMRRLLFDEDSFYAQHNDAELRRFMRRRHRRIYCTLLDELSREIRLIRTRRWRSDASEDFATMLEVYIATERSLFHLKWFALKHFLGFSVSYVDLNRVLDFVLSVSAAR